MGGKAYFVSGIDTDVGKTVATGMMARYLMRSGRDVATFKLVQTGCTGLSEDILRHREICGVGPTREDLDSLTCPQSFAFPSSPLLAARREGRDVDLAAIAAAADACIARHEVTLVESAGGLAVPLAEDTLSADFAAERGWPLVLVTCGRLGAINHTLLSLDFAIARGIRVAGVVFNEHPAGDPEIAADTTAAVSRHLRRIGADAPIVRLPALDGLSPIPDVDFGEVFS